MAWSLESVRRWMVGHGVAPRRTRRRLLRYEALETRRVLATNLAAISGFVAKDATGNGRDPGGSEDVAGATLRLFMDVDNDNVFEPGGDDGNQLQTVQSGNSPVGRYTFSGLTAGNYFVELPAQTVGAVNLFREVSPRITITASEAMGVQGQPIDTFDTTQQSVSTFASNPDFDSASTAVGEAVGGARDMFVQRTSSSGQLDLQANLANPGILTVGALGSATGMQVVTWDGPTATTTTTPDHTGLGGVDLTNAGQISAIQLMIGASEMGGQATVRVFTDADNWSRAIFTVPQTTQGAPTGEVLLNYLTDFQTGPGATGPATFSNVATVQFLINATIVDVDMQLDIVQEVGPTVKSQDFENFQPIDLELVKSVDNSSPALNDQVTFTITVTNVGPQQATGVQVTDNLPAGLQFVSANPAADYNANTGVWNIGAINGNNGSAQLTITATVTTPGAKTNIAQVSAANEMDVDSTPNNNLPAEDDQDDATLNTPSADLSINKVVDNATANVGDTVEFTVTLTNQGPDTGTNVVVLDQLPAGLTFVSATPAAEYNATNGQWNVGTITTTTPRTLTIRARVDTAGSKTNTAQVFAVDQPDIDSTPNNNLLAEDDQDDAVLTTPVVDLAVTKMVDNATPNVGQNVTFTIGVTNNGPDAATGVALTDVLPAGMTFVSANPAAEYNQATGVWTVGALANNASDNLTITATVNTVGTKTNTARLSAVDQTDSNPNNNEASALVTPPSVDLQITKEDSPDQVTPGGTLTYTLTVTNNGPSAATGVMAQETLPAGVTMVANSTPSAGTQYNPNTNVWTIGNLANAGTATLQLTINVPAGATAPLTNTAVVSGNEAETNSNNNTATVTTPLAQLASLAGCVYVDRDNDGFRDPGEAPIPGVMIRLTGVETGSNNPVDRMETTGADGCYLFDNLMAGQYILQETQPLAFRDGQDRLETPLPGDPDGVDAATDDAFQDIDLLAGVNGVDFNFGELGATLSKRRFLASS